MSEASAVDRPRRGPSLLDEFELACGRSVDETLEQATNGRAGELDDHQSGCVHCQAALSEFAGLWSPVAEYAGRSVSVPDDFTVRVMDRVQRLARDVWYTANITDEGVVRVAARIVGRIARDAARSVPGVQAALGRTTHGRMVRLVERATRGHLHPHSAVGVLGQTTSIDMAIAVAYGDPVHELAEQVQQRIKQRLHESITLQDITVNVTIDDVWLAS